MAPLRQAPDRTHVRRRFEPKPGELGIEKAGLLLYDRV